MWSQKHKLSTKEKIQGARKKFIDGVVAAFRTPKVDLPASPVPHLLLSNIPPSDAEVAVIKGAIDEAREEHSLILSAEADNQGSEPRTEIYQRERIVEFIDQHQHILSVIRCFPQEILQHIFLDFADSWMLFSTDHIDPRWAVGQVCRSWRISALSLSSLWSKLPPLYLDPGKKYKKARLNLFHEFLRRSRGAPLNVRVYGLWSMGAYDGSTHPIFTLLLGHCERWQCLSIEVSIPTLLGIQGIKGHLPLQNLTLRIKARDHASRLPPSLVDIFRVAPCLQEVAITGEGATTELALPFSQLTRYETASGTVSLDNYPQLHTFSVTSHRELNRIFQSVPVRPTVMSFTKLIFRASLSEHHSRELRFIRLPFIRDMCIESDTPTLCRDLTFILSHTMESCILTKLELRTQYHDRLDLLALLAVTPALVRLEAIISFFGIIMELASTKGDKVFVPLLENCLFLIYSDDLNDDMRTSVILFARWRCERADDFSNNGVRRVTIFEVHDFDALRNWSLFNRKESCLKQTDFETWRNDSDDSFINEFNDMEAFKTGLKQELGSYGFHHRKNGKSWADTPKTRRVEKVLMEIE